MIMESLNHQLKLNPQIFELSVKQQAIRDGFGEGLVIAGENDNQVVTVCSDLSESTRVDKFAEKFPNRFIQVGVAEQNLASVASGLAAMGKIPFITSYAIFSPGRNWEQIRTTICYNNQNVKIVGSHAGVSVGPDGGSHQALEDIAITRVIPRMTVLVPTDAEEAKKATLAAAKIKGPVYLRLARHKTPIITTSETPFVISQANVLIESLNPEALIIACGPMVWQALMAAKTLLAEGLSVTVVNCHSIKPIDSKTIVKLASQAGAVVTAEEHQIIGGLGSAVAEILALEHPVPMEFVGVDDKFGQSGTPAELFDHYSLTAKDIIRAVRRVIKRKNI